MTRIAIVDDQREAFEGLSGLIKNYEKKRECRSFEIRKFEKPDVFLASFIKDSYDIIFLDIAMEPISGIDIAKRVRHIDKKVFLVFTTGIKNKRASAFDVRAFGYLVKPVQKDDIAKIFDDYFSYMNEIEFGSSESIVYLNRIEDTHIKTDSVFYIEQSGNKSTIYAKYDKDEVYDTLKNILPKLPNYFARCHRSFIINMNEIHRREANQCVMKNNTKIPIGSRFGKEFKKTYYNFLYSSENSLIFKQ